MSDIDKALADAELEFCRARLIAGDTDPLEALRSTVGSVPSSGTAIDISVYQGHPDFGAIRGAGISLCIMRCGIITGGGVSTDSVYLANRASARGVGLPIGHYLFNGAMDAAVAADQQWAIMDWHPGEPVVIDVEGGAGTVWNPSQVLAWIQRMLAHGVPIGSIGVYMSSSVTRSQDWSAVAATGAFLWVASYGANNGQVPSAPAIAHWSSWMIWQYTSVATCAGVSGRVDTSLLAPGWTGGGSIGKDMTMFGFLYSPSVSWKFLVIPGVSIKNTPDSQAEVALGLAGLSLGTVGDLGTLDQVLWDAGFDDQFGGPNQPADAWALLQTLSGGKTLYTTWIQNATAGVTLTAAQIAEIAAQIPAPTVDLSALETAIGNVATELQALDSQADGYQQALLAVLAKGLTGTVTLTPAK